MRLKKATIEAAEPGEKLYSLMDDEVRGFGVRIHPASSRYPKGRRTFFVRTYPRGTSKECRTMLGDYGAITLDQARAEALRLIAMAEQGGFPTPTLKAQQQEAMSELTMEELASLYLGQHIDVHSTKKTQISTHSLFRVHIVPHLGKMNCETIRRQDVAKWHALLGSKSPAVANRALTTVAAMLTWGTSNGHRNAVSNPCRSDKRGAVGLKRFDIPLRERFLTAEELLRLETTLQRIGVETRPKAGQVSINVCELIRALLYTGARLSEVWELRWCDVNLERGVFLVYKNKEKRPKSIVLSQPALDVFKRQLARTGGAPDKKVFPVGDPQHSWAEVIRPAAGLDGKDGQPPFRIHDFRHNFVSVGVNAGLPLSVIGRAVGHSHTATTTRYAHYADATLINAVQMVGGKIKAKTEN